ncbi:MAG TPA: hypothetical protein VFG90_00750 [Nitrososphaeraceae archaeon]|nr:hypothetical protein [Nitrososphaeraceae archaeon]
MWNPVLAQLPSATGIGVIINTPADSDKLPTGDLTIYGTSSDSNTTNCQVFADWNDLKPMQNVTPNGPKGNSDYSKWSFTYTGSYHGIVEGPNELTSKITCFEQGQNASSKSYSINVTGSGTTSEITNNTAQKSNEVVNTKDIDNKVANILPANSNTSNTDSSINTDQSSEDVDVEDVANEEIANEETNALPVNNNKNNSTYKILPLYSESDEESTTSTFSEDADHSEIRNMRTAGSQDGFSSGETIDTGSGTYTTYNSEQQGAIGVTNNLDMATTDTSDEGLTSQSESSTFFTYEPDLVEDTSNHNDVNAFGTTPDSESSFSNHEIDDNSIFGLKFSGLDDVTQNTLEKKIEKLEDRITDRMSLFDLVG